MHTSEFINDEYYVEMVEELSTEGATALTYKVRVGGRRYFMKVLRHELAMQQRFRTLFHKEYELGCRINNRHVVRYENIGENEYGLYVLMEYVNGVNIEEKLSAEPKFFGNESNIYKFLLQLLEGLQAFHSKNIVYLDLNPKNVMFTQVGNDVKIVDLGFCMDAEYGYTAGRTAGFAAPELLSGNLNEVDARTDIYSVGCLLSYIKERSGTKYSRFLNSVMQRCLNKDKSKRFQTVSEMVRALRNRNKSRWGVVCSMAVLLLVGLFVLLPGGTESVGTAVVNVKGIEYMMLSQENLTCEVVGGEGHLGNLYIQNMVSFGEYECKTVAIKDSAFYGRSIKSLYLPEGIEFVGYRAFSSCDSVVTVTLPGSIKVFDSAFAGMKGVRKIKLPSVNTISVGAFSDCDKLDDVYIPEGVERLSLDAFALCDNLKNIYLPQTLKVIERGVFYACSTLEKITVPAGVQEIGDYAFYECKSLRNVYLHAMVPPAITVIFNTPDVTVHVPAGALEAYRDDFNWQEYNVVGDL